MPKQMGCNLWIGWCETDDCHAVFDTKNPAANFEEAVDHVVKTAHTVWWRTEETGRLTPEAVAAAR